MTASIAGIPRTYAVIGTGGIGGYYGAMLQKAGAEVHFLLRSDYDHVRQHGLTIQSVNGDFVLPQVKAYGWASEMPRCDVVLVALKTTQNHLLPSLLPPLLKPDSVVVLLQNGLGFEPDVARIVEPVPVVGCLCFICTTRIGPGHIHHLDYGSILLAQYADDYTACGRTTAMRDIGGDFQRAGISVELGEDLLLARWQKLVWNIPFNGLSIVLNAQTDELIANPDIQDLVLEIMHEVKDIAGAYGRSISEQFVQDRIQHTVKMKPYAPSSKVDYDAARPVEIEAIFGNPLRAARQAGVSAPRIQCLYQQIKFLDARNRQGWDISDRTMIQSY